MPTARFDLTLMRLGALTVIAGLFTGFDVMGLPLPRLGLSAHLTGLSDGVMLMAFAVAWPHLVLPRLWSLAGKWAAAISLPGVWASLLFGAVVGAERIAPLAGGRDTAGPILGAIAAIALTVTSLLVLVAALILFVGLMRLKETSHAQP